MNIEHLKVFIEVVERGNISIVAEASNISQSALSQQIQGLERQFGIKLLERSHKGVIPTEAGKIVFEQALKIVEAYENSYHKVKLLQQHQRQLKIIATPIAYSYALPCALFHFKNTYPDYLLEVETAQSSLVEERILSGYGDVGIIAGRAKDKRLTSKKVFSDEVFLVAGETLRLPDKLSIKGLCDYPILTLAKGHRTQQLLDSQLYRNGVDCSKLKVLYTLDSIESLKLSAINGYGLAFLPYMAIKKDLYLKQLRLIKYGEINLQNSYYSVVKKETCSSNGDNEKMIRHIEKILKDTIC